MQWFSHCKKNQELLYTFFPQLFFSVIKKKKIFKTIKIFLRPKMLAVYIHTFVECLFFQKASSAYLNTPTDLHICTVLKFQAPASEEKLTEILIME